MRVCIDIQSAIAQRAGVGRYTKSLVEHLGAEAGDDDLALFYFDFKRRGTPFESPQAMHRAVHWCPGRLAQYAWKTFSWPPFDWFAGKADLYHFPNFVLPPLTRGKSVVTIHDVSFLRHPETTETKNLDYLNAKIRDTVARADAIITDSEFSAREIRELLQVPPEQLHPIHLGLSEDFARPSREGIDATRQSLGLAKPYLLTVGTLEPRKNIAFLIEVFEHLTAFDGELVVAGMKGWKYEPILQRIQISSRAEDIRLIDGVGDKDLPGLYAGAELFVFPSLYEGFGLPPLEAMKCGTPVVSSSAGSLPEVLGDAAEMIEDYDPEAWADRLRALLSDTDRRQKMRDNGLEWVRRYTWEETARQTWKVYREVQA